MVNDTDDHDQRQIWLHVRSRLTERFSLGARYRFRHREYSTGLATARNFGREDDRQQVVATADLQTGSRLGWGLYYAHEDADSTLDTRDYVVSSLYLTARLRF